MVPASVRLTSIVVRHFAARFGAAVQGNGHVTGIRISMRQGGDLDLAVEVVFIYLQGSLPITDFLLGQLEVTCFARTSSKPSLLPLMGSWALAIEVEKHLKHRSKAKINLSPEQRACQASESITQCREPIAVPVGSYLLLEFFTCPH